MADGARNAWWIIEPGGVVLREYTPVTFTPNVSAMLPQARVKL